MVVFLVILIHFFLISNKYEMFHQTSQMISQSDFDSSKIFQQMSQPISQSDSDSIENHLSKETEMFIFLSEFEIIPNTS
jgi:hypothetical protein